MTDYLNDRSWVNADTGSARFNVIVAAHLGWSDFIGLEDPYPSGRAPATPYYRLIEEYTTEFNEALTLISGPLRLSLHNEDFPQWTAVVWEDEGGHTFNDFVGSAMTPAMAICKAWLRWQENKSHVQPKENLE